MPCCLRQDCAAGLRGETMQYPCLVPKRLCRTEISLSFDREGITEYGEPLPAVKYTGKCNYQDKARTILTAEKKLVEITGSALFPGDICPAAVFSS